MSGGLLYCEVDLQWQWENNMARIEGMKVGSQAERDRPVISSEHGANSHVSPSPIAGVKEWHNNKDFSAVIFNHRSMDYLSMDTSNKVCGDVGKHCQEFHQKRVLRNYRSLWFSSSHSLTSCYTRRPGSCVVAWWWSVPLQLFAHSQPRATLSLQHPAPVLHNTTYVHFGLVWE